MAVQLVDKDLARTNIPGEMLIGIEMEHHSSWRLDAQESVWKSVVFFLEQSLAEARTRLDSERRGDSKPEILTNSRFTNRQHSDPPFAIEPSTFTRQSSQISLCDGPHKPEG